MTKYYYAGSQRIAMRKNGTLTFILGDHLGSTSLVTDSSGNVINETKYKAWGETRYSSSTEQTKYTYTGQYSYVSDFGLHFYNARWYDSSLGRFAQADSIIPGAGNPSAWDRYAYVLNNPLRYTDPSGHFTCSSNPNSDDYCPSQTSGGSNRPTMDPPRPPRTPSPTPDPIPVCSSSMCNPAYTNNNNISISIGLDDIPGSAELYSGISLGLDSIALGIDLSLEAIALTGAAIGYTSGATFTGGTPVTGLPGAFIGWSIVQMWAQQLLSASNWIALSATAFGTIGDDIGGNTEIGLNFTSSPSGNSLVLDMQLSSTVQEAWALTFAGFQGQAQIAEASLLLQSAAVANDLGLLPPTAWGTLDISYEISWP